MTPVPIRAIAISGAVVIALLAVAHFTLTVGQLPGKEAFDLDQESGPGTWFNSTLLVAGGTVALLIAHLRRVEEGTWRAPALFGLVAVAFGVEEVAAFHERLSGKLESITDRNAGIEEGTSILGLLVAPVAIVGILMMVRLLEPRVRRRFVAGGSLWLAATFGIEYMESWNTQGRFRDIAAFETLDRVLTGTQETLEMVGGLLLLIALLRHLALTRRRIVLEVRDD